MTTTTGNFLKNSPLYFDSMLEGDLFTLKSVCLERKRQEVDKRVSVGWRGRRNGGKEVASQGQAGRAEVG